MKLWQIKILAESGRKTWASYYAKIEMAKNEAKNGAKY